MELLEDIFIRCGRCGRISAHPKMFPIKVTTLFANSIIYTSSFLRLSQAAVVKPPPALVVC